MSVILFLINGCLLFHLVNGNVLKASIDDVDYSENFMHPAVANEINYGPLVKPELNSNYYLNMAKQFVNAQINRKFNKNRAKNVILFLGDGMSVATLATTRVYLGGEEKTLSFEEFPDVGMVKTYCVNAQVADSACTATAYLSGVKGNFGTIGVNAKVSRSHCYTGLDKKKHTESIAKWALAAGKSIGIVTTTRVTHASPAGVYAHTAERDWESNTDIVEDSCSDSINDDIAKQLVYGEVGSRLKVIFGGGRREFRDVSTSDEEGKLGRRTDRRDLVQEWLNYTTIYKRKRYVWNKEGLANIHAEGTDSVLGLFEASHCKFNHQIDGISDADPTLTEMTMKAIEILGKNENGFFLFVEGGRIDHGHHNTQAHKAISETAEFSKAVGMVHGNLNANETLIVVTSDHGHAMSYSGYSNIGSDIFGSAGRSDIDHLPYLKLSYANGLGYNVHKLKSGRADPTKMDVHNFDFEFPATVPRESETHAGDDVAVFASGPFSHLFRGVFEQSYIPHLMAYAACIGHGLTACR